MNSSLIIKAREFARLAHASIGQVRKYTGEPYHVHVWDVERRVSQYTDDPEVLAAANLHDVLEDVFPVNALYNERLIEVEFGSRVLGFVKDLTDEYTHEAYPQLPRRVRKHLEADRLGNVAPESQTIKCGDLQSNTEDIVKNDPGFAKVYLREKEVILSFLTKADPRILQETIKALETAKEELRKK